MERKTCLQGILHISQKPQLLGSPAKEPSLKVPLMESLAERCPTNTAPLYSSIKSPRYMSPPHPKCTKFPSDGKVPPWREMPMPTSRDFSNISSKVAIEGAPHPEAPSTEPLMNNVKLDIVKLKIHPPSSCTRMYIKSMSHKKLMNITS
jgi:hypothetical protein